MMMFGMVTIMIMHDNTGDDDDDYEDGHVDDGG